MQKNDIKFFLFCPGLSAFRCLVDDAFDVIVPGLSITYENGAIVNTAFVTNLPTTFSVETSADLYKKLKEANKENSKSKQLPKYAYPNHVLRSTELQKFSKIGVEYKVKKGSCYRISKLESQKKAKKTFFGGGLLLSSKAAAEKAAAEKAAEKAAAEKAEVIRWKLSEKELKIIKELDSCGHA